jgi:hypothetical protein
VSLFTQCFSFLAIKPKVWIEGDRLYARASLAGRFASLGAYDRCVIADRRERVVSIHTKGLWSWQPVEKIPFDRVDEIDRSFKRWTTNRGPYYNPGRRGNDQLEFLQISLFLRNPQEHVNLFWFWGEGSVANGATGVLLGNDDVFDFAGDQRAASERYAKLLAAFIGARIHNFPAQGMLETIDRVV